MLPKVVLFDGDESKWTRVIDGSGYWDFIRFFFVRYRNLYLLFDAPFLELADEYSDFFLIYMTSGEVADLRKESKQWPLAHVVPVSEITFDETRRKHVLTESISALCRGYEFT
jgi:hypothetical protein